MPARNLNHDCRNTVRLLLHILLVICGVLNALPLKGREAPVFSPVLVTLPDASGHKSVAISDESIASIPGIIFFSSLKQCTPASSSAVITDYISSKHQNDAAIAGFMHPLQDGTEVKSFILLPHTHTCGLERLPEPNEYVLVESEQAIEPAGMKPVLVNGSFFVERDMAGGFLFRMTGKSTTIAVDETFLTASGTSQDLPELNWDEFESAVPALNWSSQEAVNSYSFAALINHRVKIAGFLVEIRKGTPGEVVIAKNFWDGCCTGVPPELSNSVLCVLSESGPEPQTWHKSCVAVGLLERTPNNCIDQKGPFIIKDTVFISLSEHFHSANVRTIRIHPLLTAVENGELSLVKMLVRSGADINVQNEKGNGVLHIAAKKGHCDLLEMFIAAGLQVNAGNSENRTPIYEAISGNSSESCKLLVDAGSELNRQDKYGFSALLWAIAQGSNGEIPRLLISYNADPHLKNIHGKAAIHLAVENGQREIVSLLCEKGVPINSPDGSGLTPLQIAEKMGNTEMINLIRSLAKR